MLLTNECKVQLQYANKTIVPITSKVEGTVQCTNGKIRVDIKPPITVSNQSYPIGTYLCVGYKLNIHMVDENICSTLTDGDNIFLVEPFRARLSCNASQNITESSPVTAIAHEIMPTYDSSSIGTPPTSPGDYWIKIVLPVIGSLGIGSIISAVIGKACCCKAHKTSTSSTNAPDDGPAPGGDFASNGYPTSSPGHDHTPGEVASNERDPTLDHGLANLKPGGTSIPIICKSGSCYFTNPNDDINIPAKSSSSSSTSCACTGQGSAKNVNVTADHATGTFIVQIGCTASSSYTQCVGDALGSLISTHDAHNAPCSSASTTSETAPINLTASSLPGDLLHNVTE